MIGLTILLTIFLLPCAFGLKCYECSGSVNTGCNEPFDNVNIEQIDCVNSTVLHPHHRNATYECVSYTNTHHRDNSNFTVRQCIFKKSGCSSLHGKNEMQNCKICDTDGCNFAENLHFSYVILPVLLFFTLYSG